MYLKEIVELIDDLEGACIRFVHFSKENELRSRVFSEKMGLEAGWNCHISLLSEAPVEDTSSLHGVSQSNVSAASQILPHSIESLPHGRAKPFALERRNSAPSVFNTEMTQVAFEPCHVIHDQVNSQLSCGKLKHEEHCDTPLLQHYGKEVDHDVRGHAEVKANCQVDGAFMSREDRAPSIASFQETENTDSTTGGLSFSNRVCIYSIHKLLHSPFLGALSELVTCMNLFDFSHWYCLRFCSLQRSPNLYSLPFGASCLRFVCMFCFSFAW